MKRDADASLTLCTVVTSCLLLLWPGSVVGMLFARLTIAIMWFIIVSKYAEFGERGSRVVERACEILAPLLFVTAVLNDVVRPNSWTQSGTVLAGVACAITASALLSQSAVKSGSSSVAAWLMAVGALAGSAAPSLDGESWQFVGLVAVVGAIVILAALLPRRRRVFIH